MNANKYGFKFNYSSLWHLWQGSTQFISKRRITISRDVFLVDVSKWQGGMDWAKAKSKNLNGAIIKCGQGIAKDPQFDANWTNAKLQSIPRGSYWFWDSRYPPKTQAYWWWEWIKKDIGELAHYADYEESYGGQFGGYENFRLFLMEFERLSNLPARRRGIYTGYYYWIAHSPANLVELSWFTQFPLWLAWYTNNPANVRIPKPWSDLILWQYGTPAIGYEYGADSREIDANNFNGDEAAYQAYYGLEPSPPPQPETQTLRRLILTFTGDYQIREE